MYLRQASFSKHDEFVVYFLYSYIVISITKLKKLPQGQIETLSYIISVLHNFILEKLPKYA